MPHQVGYCCINFTLGKDKITTGRTLRQASFKQDTKLERTSLLALQNATDLVKILKWNEENNVKVFRIGSNIFPWNSEYEVTQLPDYSPIVEYLQLAGQIIKQSGQRVSFHPDHFVKLGTVKDIVVRRSIHDLNHHDWILNMMGLPATHYYPLNIHVGMNISFETTNRFMERFEMLNDTTKARLVVENDDKANAYSVKQLYDDIYSRIKTPITFDYFHHTFHSSGLTSEEAAKMAAETWDCKPLFHYSESKNLNENVTGNPRAHSDYALLTLDDYGLNIDVDLETKAKELAWTVYMRNLYDQMVS
jgi:UV DNA damage endonuclease